MSSPLTSAGFADLLDPTFRDVAKGAYDKGKSRIGELFSEETSSRNLEKYSEVTPLGKFTEFTGAVPYQGIEQGYDVTATHKEFASAIQIQRKLYDDDQQNVIAEVFSGLGVGAFKTQEDDAADILNSGFSLSSSFYSHSAGVALFSNSHTCPDSSISTTVGFDNLTTSDLSPTALVSAITQFRQFKDDAGDRIDYVPNELWVPVELEARAKEILQTSAGLDDANQNVNVLKSAFTLKTWSRMTDANNWFLFNSDLRNQNLIWFWRVKLELARMESFDNITAKGRGYMRYSYLWRNWRCGLGAQVS